MLKIVKEGKDNSELFNKFFKIRKDIYSLTDDIKSNVNNEKLLPYLGRLKTAIDEITYELHQLDTVPGYEIKEEEE